MLKTQKHIVRPINEMSLGELDDLLDLLKSNKEELQLTQKEKKMTENFCYLSKLRIVYKIEVDEYRKMLHFFAFYIRYLAQFLNVFSSLVPLPFAKSFVKERNDFLYDFTKKMQDTAEKFAIEIETTCNKESITKTVLHKTVDRVLELKERLGFLLKEHKKSIMYYVFVDMFFLITLLVGGFTLIQVFRDYIL